MRVFVLCTGRSGSTAFASACRHIRNYTSGHETGWDRASARRVVYPDQHIEVDNRLVWYAGRLEKLYGDSPFYVHLLRDRDAVVNAFSTRLRIGIMSVWPHVMGWTSGGFSPRDQVCDYVDAVNENIGHFLRDKSKVMTLQIERANEQFPAFCEAIGAEVDLAAALRCVVREAVGAREQAAGPP